MVTIVIDGYGAGLRSGHSPSASRVIWEMLHRRPRVDEVVVSYSRSHRIADHSHLVDSTLHLRFERTRVPHYRGGEGARWPDFLPGDERWEFPSDSGVRSVVVRGPTDAELAFHVLLLGA